MSQNGRSPLVRVHDLTIDATIAGEPRRLVAGVDLEVHAGECVAIVGESGSGKSLTARALLGLLPPGVRASGRYVYDGNEVSLDGSDKSIAALRGSRIGLVLQDPFTSLNPLMRCGAQICDIPELRRLPRSERRSEAIARLQEVGIGDPSVVDRFPFQLSGGMRQRVALTAALASDPSVLIADEFSTALDVTTQSKILALLNAIRARRAMSLVLITHDLQLAFTVADRIYVMYAGQLMEVGRALTVHDSPAHPYTLNLLMAEPSLDRRVSSSVDRTISTRVPQAADVLDRCAFADRCAWSTEECKRSRPELRERLPDRSSACVRMPEITAQMRRTATEVESGEFLVRVEDKKRGDPGLVAVHDLSKTFTTQRMGTEHRVDALKGVSLAVASGESLGIVGESGSGKTTLARCLVGLENADGGGIVMDGISISDWRALPTAKRRHLRNTIQYIFQDPYSSLNPTKTVGKALTEVVRYAAGASRDQARSRVLELLELVGLPEHYLVRKPVALSGGERQRVAIARALAVNPRVLICDEPVSALDVSVQAQILELFAELRQRTGVTYLFITHDLAVVRQVADRVVVMLNGAIVEEGSVDALFADPQHPYTRTLLASVPTVEGRSLAGSSAGHHAGGPSSRHRRAGV